MKAERLRYGDEIRVIAPSRSLSVVRKEIYDKALEFLTGRGFRITFSANCRERDEADSSSVRSRTDDIHEAFLDKNVKAILTCIGGFNVNQILEYIDYSVIAANPKILCGYSDITALLNAIYAKTGLVTYNGPHFSSFGFDENIGYTEKYFNACLMREGPYFITPSEQAKGYHIIREGTCRGTIAGGNLCTFNLLQGTAYMPDLSGKIIFLEDDNISGDYFTSGFDRDLQSLIQSAGSNDIKGIVLGRFDSTCGMDLRTVDRIIAGKKQLNDIPVVFNVDFGHVFPFATFPIGGEADLTAADGHVSLEISSH
jgi:muramoyltetrapeptide carboxypeptidase